MPPPGPSSRAVIFGCGYVGLALASALVRAGWHVTGTGRAPGSLAAIEAVGARARLLEDPALAEELAGADCVAASIPPHDAGDPAFVQWQAVLSQHPPRWTGYLSTTGVYGDRQGRWAFEDEPLTPASTEAKRRALAEAQWQSEPVRAHVFRLPGIYGPGRSAIDQVRAGTARALVRPGQVFSRIHRDDIVTALLASLACPTPGVAFNLADDEPAPSYLVTEEAARLLGVAAPPRVPVEQAGLSPMGQRFWSECKRIPNGRAKATLGWRPFYPTYREGLRACLEVLET